MKWILLGLLVAFCLVLLLAPQESACASRPTRRPRHTHHSQQRMNQRGVSQQDIQAALNSPDRVLRGRGGKQGFEKSIGGRALCVIATTRHIVITTYWLRPNQRCRPN